MARPPVTRRSAAIAMRTGFIFSIWRSMCRTRCTGRRGCGPSPGFARNITHATDASQVTGTGGRGDQWLAQPKASLILGPWQRTELYLSYGRGFHSDDVRGVFGTVPGEGAPLAGGRTPLLAATTGEEIALRTDARPARDAAARRLPAGFRIGTALQPRHRARRRRGTQSSPGHRSLGSVSSGPLDRTEFRPRLLPRALTARERWPLSGWPVPISRTRRTSSIRQASWSTMSPTSAAACNGDAWVARPSATVIGCR